MKKILCCSAILTLLVAASVFAAGEKKAISPQELIPKYEQAVAVDSLNVKARFDLANTYYDAGKLDEAEREYRTILRQDPGFSGAYTNLGALLNEKGRGAESIVLLQTALEKNPKDTLARSNLGNTLYSEKKYPQAVKELMQALKDDPNCYQAYYNLGVAFADAGIYREARRMWEKVVSIAPDSQAASTARDNIKAVKEMTGDH